MKWWLLIVFLVVATSVNAAQYTLFFDDFNGSINASWNLTTAGSYNYSYTTDQNFSPPGSAKINESVTAAIRSPTLNNSMCTDIIASAQTRDHLLELGDVSLQFLDSSLFWRTVLDIGSDTENTWVYKEKNINATLNTSFFHDSFAARFLSTTGAGESFWFDDFNVTCTYDSLTRIDTINTSPAQPNRTSTMLGLVNASTNVTGNMSFECNWYRNGTLNLTVTTTPIYLNATQYNIANATGTAVGQSWIFGCRVNNTNGEFSDWRNSSTVVIQNQLPSLPAINYTPATVFISNTLNITAYNSTDADNDTLTYYRSYTNLNQSFPSPTPTIAVTANTNALLNNTICRRSDNTLPNATILSYDINVQTIICEPNQNYACMGRMELWSGNSTHALTQHLVGSTINFQGQTTTSTHKLSGITNFDMTNEYLWYCFNTTGTSSGINMNYGPQNDSMKLKYDNGTQITTESRWLNGSVTYRNDTYTVTSTYAITANDIRSVIRLRAKAYDGYNFGAVAELNVTVSNTPPSAPVINLTPSTIVANTSLNAGPYNSTDNDSDSISYYCEWYNINITSAQNYSTTCTYQLNTTDEHKDIRLRVKAYDGYNYSTVTEQNFTVANSIAVASAIISPSPSNTSVNLTCAYSCVDNDTTDNCSTSITYDWFKNNASLGFNTSLLLNGNYTPGDNIICSVYGYDGFNTTPWSNSSIMIIGDETPPLLSSFGITPTIQYATLGVVVNGTCTDENPIGGMKAQVTNPSNTSTNYTMTQVGSVFSLVYVPPSEGTYAIMGYCLDGSGNTAGSSPIALSVLPAPNTGGGGGGGGGGSTTIITGDTTTYTISPATMEYSVTKGSTSIGEFSIENTGSTSFNVSVKIRGGNAATWTTFDGIGKEIIVTLKSGEQLESPTQYVRYSMKPPASLSDGEYTLDIEVIGAGVSQTHRATINVREGLFSNFLAWLNEPFYENQNACVATFSTTDTCTEGVRFSNKLWFYPVAIIIVIGGFMMLRRKR
jgi:hypothetical protein